MALAIPELDKGTNPYIYNIAIASTYRDTTQLSLAPDARALFINDGDCGEIAPAEHHFSQRGRKRYELNSHLGNTHTIVTDQKHREGVEYVANVTQSRHYFPFGLVDEEYSFINPDYEDAYRYGFNGKEEDEDLQSDDGTNVVLDYGFRIYNPAVARFLSVDPLTSSYPWYTPYQFAGNKPIAAVDLDGLEELIAIVDLNQGVVTLWADKEMLRSTQRKIRIQLHGMFRDDIVIPKLERVWPAFTWNTTEGLVNTIGNNQTGQIISESLFSTWIGITKNDLTRKAYVVESIPSKELSPLLFNGDIPSLSQYVSLQEFVPEKTNSTNITNDGTDITLEGHVLKPGERYKLGKSYFYPNYNGDFRSPTDRTLNPDQLKLVKAMLALGDDPSVSSIRLSGTFRRGEGLNKLSDTPRARMIKALQNIIVELQSQGIKVPVTINFKDIDESNDSGEIRISIIGKG